MSSQPSLCQWSCADWQKNWKMPQEHGYGKKVTNRKSSKITSKRVLNTPQVHNQTDNLRQFSLCPRCRLFSFELFINVVSHDAVVWVVLVRVMALVKYQQREQTQRSDVTFDHCVLHDLWSHDQNVVLRCEVMQWQLRVLVSAQSKCPQ